MISASDLYAQLELRFTRWALTQPAIQAVLVVGSRARSIHPADEWSDLDVVVLASATASYLNDATWLEEFGEVMAAISDSFGQRDREWIALYADGVKLDAAFLSIDPVTTPTLQMMLDAFPYPAVLQRGVRVLVEKTGSSPELRLPTIGPPLPDQAEFTGLINRVCLDAIKAAKFIRRYDLWRAKHTCDGEMKQHLLRMIEWQATANMDEQDIWYDGRFLGEWADAESLTTLPATFAAYDAADLARALVATLDLFRRLAREVSIRLGYTYPAEIERLVDAHLRTVLQGKS
jgi:aminoglycoside 6-adenylyltransferase